MKTFLKNAMLVAGLILFSFSLRANGETEMSKLPEDTLKKETETLVLRSTQVVYAQVRLAQVPVVVKSALASRFSAYVLSEAYKGNDSTYKLILKREEIKMTVYYSENGTFIKKEVAHCL